MATVAIDASEAAGGRLRGWGRYVRELVDALAARPPDGVAIDVLEHEGRLPELAWEQIGLPIALRRRRPALVHSPNCFLPLARPCPGVVTVHDLAFEAFPEDFAPRTRWKYRTFTRRSARSAERVIVDASVTRDDLAERYGVDPRKVRVIPLAPSLPTGSEEPPDGPYLLAVGDVREKKNLLRLVAAFRRLRVQERIPHRLVLAGPDAGAAEQVRAAAGDEPVELTGWISDERLDALMRGADVLVHPSLYEGFGLVVVEAMARGTPVVAANATSLPEAGGDAAVYVDPLDVDDIAAGILRVLRDDVLRADLVRRGRSRVAELSWERTAALTGGVYLELVG